ncbi:MAG TPA: hypothetical protein VFX97_15595 [Pyrinomonadaceae bacterium]|nr:hypothetical protein [Pyrinomonadaceae bacterium]
MGILIWIALLGCIICQIIVAIKIFQNDGALKGIIALICGLFGLIWGWMNAARLGVKNIMIIWTLLIVVYVILGAIGGFNFSYSLGTPTP